MLGLSRAVEKTRTGCSRNRAFALELGLWSLPYINDGIGSMPNAMFMRKEGRKRFQYPRDAVRVCHPSFLLGDAVVELRCLGEVDKMLRHSMSNVGSCTDWLDLVPQWGRSSRR